MIYIVTDGSSRGNPGPGGWGSITFCSDQVVERGGFQTSTTNNRMELTAIIESLRSLDKAQEVTLYTDSAYAMNGAQSWLQGWKKNNWKTSTKQDVLNKDLWQVLDELLNHHQIIFVKVKGHSGHPLNERADTIATSFADGNPTQLFCGSQSEYDYSLASLIQQQESKESRSTRTPSRSSSQKAYSYVSLVDGIIIIHPTWSSCEERVKGASRARYKKSFSAEDERDIVDDFKKSIP